MDTLSHKIVYFLFGVASTLILCLVLGFFAVDMTEEKAREEFEQEAVENGHGTIIEDQFFWKSKDADPVKKKKKFLFW